MTISTHTRVFLAGLFGTMLLVAIGWWVVDVWRWPTRIVTTGVTIHLPRSWAAVPLGDVPVQVRPLAIYKIQNQVTATLTISTIPGGAVSVAALASSVTAAMKEQTGDASVVAQKQIRRSPAQPLVVVAGRGGLRQVVSVVHVGSTTYRLAATIPADLSDHVVRSVITAFRRFDVKG